MNNKMLSQSIANTILSMITIEEYIALAKELEGNQCEYFTASGMGNDIYQFSPLPWISFTHISNTDTGDKECATPIFHWGKYYERDKKILMPFSVQVHHAFVDGLHVGKLANILQDYLNNFQQATGGKGAVPFRSDEQEVSEISFILQEMGI